MPRELQFALSVRDSALASLLDLLREQMRETAHKGSVYLESLLHTLMLRYIHLAIGKPSPDSWKSSPLPTRSLKRVKEIVEARLDASLSLEELAAVTGYSRGHFLRMFHRATGMTPHQYIIERRIEKARLLLEAGSTQVGDIAAACGFAGATHMASLFRKRLGMTPLEFRRQIQ